MDRHASNTAGARGLHDKRKFEDVSVGRCTVQTATDRFGEGAGAAIRDRERVEVGIAPAGGEVPFTWPGSSPDLEDQGAETSMFRRVPSMQGYRNNLTALSQTHNLYFVAYQSRIFVYTPQGSPEQSIPRYPDLQLISRSSYLGRLTGGHLEPGKPHLINHLITGLLGEEEILVTCHDDGDVVAFYTKDIAETIWKQGSPSRASRAGSATMGGKAAARAAPKEFFHDNVGMSAWGLAIHTKSRLIAVSSNRHEITVFAFALAGDQAQSQETPGCCGCGAGLESQIRQRARNWRVVVLLGVQADNLPNVCFVDDAEGSAEKVCAIDVKGAIWLAYIWKPFQAATRISPLHCKSEEFFPATSRGWGVIALPETSFMKVKTLEELLGGDPRRLDFAQPTTTPSRPMAISRAFLDDIPDNPCPSAPTPAGRIWIQSGLQTVHLATHPDLHAAADEATVEEAEEEEDDDASENSDGYIEYVVNQGMDDPLSDELWEAAAMEIQDMEGQDGASDPSLYFADAGDAADLVWPLDEDPFNATDDFEDFPDSLLGIDNALPLLNSPPEHLSPLHDSSSSAPSAGAGSTDATSQSTSCHHDKPHRHCRDCRRHPATHPVVARLEKAYFPHDGTVQQLPRGGGSLLRHRLRPPPESNKIEAGGEQRLGRLTNGCHLLRALEKDLEMQGFSGPAPAVAGPAGPDLVEMGVLCPEVARFGRFQDRGLQRHFQAASRLNMVAHIPELCLVVLGSPTGRVLLVTPTRLATPLPADETGGYWDHGFRVDWVLPRASDEDRHRKVVRPLYGMALAPVRCGSGRPGTMPKRYKLMLHYRTHDILTYEISREEQTGRLCLF